MSAGNRCVGAGGIENIKAVLAASDTLAGGDVLPGFEVRVGALFAID